MGSRKILIFSLTLTYGGAERVASNLADGLASLGYNVVLYCHKEGEFTYMPSSLVVLKFYPEMELGFVGRIKNFLRNICHMRSEIKKEKPDAVIGILPQNTLKAKLGQLFSGLRIPIIYSDHDALERPDCAPLSKAQKFYKFHFSRLCDAYTVLTDVDRIYGESIGLKNIVVMPNPMGLKPLQIVPVKEKVILAVGRLSAWHCKGFDLLIEAWGKLANKYPEWNLQIAGAGDDEDRLRLLDMANIAGVKGSFELLDYTKDIDKYFKRSSIFVLSSRYEGFGLVVTEAMSQGCACIAADYKGRQSEIITDGVNGVLCDVDNVDSLATKMDILLSNEELRCKIQQAAIKVSEKFSLENYAKRWDKLIKQLVSNNKE